MERFTMELSYQWKPILINGDKEYHYPDKINSFMKENYKCPAIYRWDIYKNESNDEKLVYIGEAKQLCPDRINGYLNPGPSQQTNKRIKELFENYLDSGFRIRLDTLQLDDTKIEGLTLQDKYVRLFIEGLMIMVHRRKGFSVLNL